MGERTSGRRRWVRVVLAPVSALVGAGLGLFGCVQWGVGAIINAPNQGLAAPPGDEPGPALAGLPGEGLRVEVGPPTASLSVWLVPPAPGQQVRGTVLVLHGVRDRKESMADIAGWLREGGYRVVLVDHRGQGRSTGDWLSYGAVERRDMSQLLDWLERERPAPGGIYAFGVSYGAAVAVQLAGHDRRIDAAVAVACFTTMRRVVTEYAEHLGVGWVLPEAFIQRLVDTAGEDGGFDPDEASPLDAIALREVPILLVHGAADAHIVPDHSHALHAAAPGHTALWIVEGGEHATIFSAAGEGLETRTLEWFGAHPRVSAAEPAEGAGAGRPRP